MNLDNMFGALSMGLQRAGITTVSEWAMMYRYLDGKPYTFDRYPWAKEISDAKGRFCCQKGSQVGLTQLALNIAFKTIDIDKQSVLYILPTVPMASRFSDTKFNPAIKESPQLQGLFTDVDSKNTKVSGSVALFILGSRSEADSTGITVSTVLIDELDRCSPTIIEMARERSSSYESDALLGMFSTPTLEGHGINAQYESSTKEIFQFTCPHCNKWTWLDWDHIGDEMGDGFVRYGNVVVAGTDPENPLVNESYFMTSCCRQPLTQMEKIDALCNGKSQFVAEHPGKLMRGFYVNQLVSPTVNAQSVAQKYLQAIGDPMKTQQLMNHQIGKCHVDPDATLSWEKFDHSMRKGYAMHTRSPKDTLITIGVDIGTKIHYVVAAYKIKKNFNLLANSECRVLAAGEVDHFEQIDPLMKQFNAHFMVIDAMPEKRKATELAGRFPGRAKVCFYSNVTKTSDDFKEPDKKFSITVDRTGWLDGVYNRFNKDTILLPLNCPKEFYPHLKNLVKKYEYNKDGDVTSRYVKAKKEDHYTHALLYSNVAFVLSIGFSTGRNIEDIM